MIIACCSDSFFEWGKVFVESFYIHNKDKIKLHINGFNLTPDMIKEFKILCPHITINNMIISLESISKEIGVPVNKIKEGQTQIFKGIKNNNRFWMEYLVVDMRIKWLLETMKDNPDEKYWIHTDIDMIYRTSMDEFVEKLVMPHDVTLRFRPNIKFKRLIKPAPPDEMKIAGGFASFRGEKGIKFVERWLHHINSKPWNGINGRKEAWGQTTMYYAFKELEDYNWGAIPQIWLGTSPKLDFPVWCGHRKGKFNYRGRNINCETRPMAINNIFKPEVERMKNGQFDKTKLAEDDFHFGKGNIPKGMKF